MALCKDRSESLIVQATVAGRHGSLFHIDTGYAGAPVLSTSYLATRPVAMGGTIHERFRQTSVLLKKRITDDDRHRAVAALTATRTCRAFTSGCTMRLMGIAETSEMQADMLLCPALSLSDDPSHTSMGDVFVTHPLHGNVHILTCDFLLHHAPSVLLVKQGELVLSAQGARAEELESTFDFHPAYFVGGAFAINVVVGGASLRIVVDTGAAITLSLGRSAMNKIRTCHIPENGAQKVHQVGVHGESTCSSAFDVDVRLGKIRLNGVTTFANSDEVEGADGYMGIGLLRMMDLWLEPTRIGFRLNGLSAETSRTTKGTCGERDIVQLRCRQKR